MSRCVSSYLPAWLRWNGTNQDRNKRFSQFYGVGDEQGVLFPSRRDFLKYRESDKRDISLLRRLAYRKVSPE